MRGALYIRHEYQTSVNQRGSGCPPITEIPQVRVSQIWHEPTGHRVRSQQKDQGESTSEQTQQCDDTD
jgi:hypothetical protein